MLAPVFKTLNVPAVAALVGTPLRIYDFDSAPQGVQTPYITWLDVSGQPFDNISEAPQGDFDTIQINCYTGPADDSRAQARALALAVRNALDAALIHNRTIITTRETDTQLFRVSIEADFIHNR
ncbi:tail completion protein gp17 [Schauerella aestuarii]|uniref:tail completion protein gp17 n=1 Tax=Schauerella aestuarii TaxID=2511204 RepID=UPI00136C2EE8|nr:DUF3168 domain-containing protein [Achromobacter aestuarii]MYZ41419.1 DUF3168 domain-containing protein [Achromobacter aestuarii]